MLNNSHSLISYLKLTHEINSDDTYNIIQSLNFNNGSGLDGISCKRLKEAAPVITPSLTFVINICLSGAVYFLMTRKL